MRLEPKGFAVYILDSEGFVERVAAKTTAEDEALKIGMKLPEGTDWCVSPLFELEN